MFNLFQSPPQEVEVEFHNPEWLEDAVIYEIYPQSYNNSNGDGIGDLPGSSPGWIIFNRWAQMPSGSTRALSLPFGDAGYDVSDFYKVAPRYGTNEDLRRLFAEAKKRGMR